MKLKHFAFVALVALFAACTNQESLLKDYEKACEKGDAVKAAKIIEKMEKKYPNEADWTLEQQIRVEKASVVLSKKALENVGL
ncbi:MAG: hypothetical protein IJ204_08445 [Paludibacteraceae bacterium]|nr:hypothetical protein [Paludibacteraceae bacterium]